MEGNNLLRNLAAIEKSFSDGTLYYKKWDQETGSLRDLEGTELLVTKLTHFLGFSDDKKDFVRIFEDCMKSHQIPNDFSSSELAEVGKAWKAISHYKNEKKLFNLNKDSKTLTTWKKLENFLDTKRKALELNSRELSTEEIIQKREEIEELYSLENKYDSESKASKSKLHEYRKRYCEDLPKQAFAAHNVFNSWRNEASALEVAKTHIGDFSVLSGSKDPKVRSYAVELFNYVKHGFDAPEITTGRESPSFFWNMRKIWNTVKWSTENREQSALGDLAEKLDRIASEKASYIRNMINLRGNMMKDSLIVSYLEILSQKYPDIPFSYYFKTDKPDPSNFVENVKKRDFFNDPEQQFCFLPFVFAGTRSFFPDHIVLVILNRESGQIQYYDSQGLPPDHPDRLVFDQFNMKEALEEIRQHWEEKEKRPIEIVVNTVIHQEDTQNCGVYVSDAIGRTLAGENFESLCLQGKNHELITAQRDVIAKDIVEHTAEVDTSEIDMTYNAEEFSDSEDEF